MDLITLDFETYYAQDYSLSKLSTEAYVRDPRFETILVSVKVNDAKCFWLMPDTFKHFIATEVDWASTACVAHHTQFDGLILAHHYGVRPAFWIDTLSMARALDGPKVDNSLAGLCKRHGIGEKGNYVKFAKGKQLADFSPAELVQYGEYSCTDCDRAYALAQIFLPQIPESELRLIDLTTRMFTEPVLVGNAAKLAGAVTMERERKAALLEQVGIDKAVFSSSPKFAALLESLGVEVPMKASNTDPEKLIPAFARTDPGMQELLEDPDELIRALAETRVAVKSTIIETRAERYHGMALRGPMPVYLAYAKAHTLRWAGGDSTNWQNMSSMNENRPDLAVLKESIEAPEGHLLVAADSGQIEARWTAYLAKAPVLAAFADAMRDVYNEFAGTIYKREIRRKEVAEDHVPGQLGKVSVLGLGFGMGWYKFSLELLKGMLGAKPIQFTMADIERIGIDPNKFLNNPYKVREVDQMPSRLDLNDRLIHCLVADAIVQHYRTTNPEIVAYWALMEQVIDAMIQGEELVFGAHGILRTTDRESILLPNGMELHYHGIERDEKGQATYFNGRQRTKIYGGLLTENVVQCLARCVVAEQMLVIANRHKVALMTHDEVLTVVPEADAERTLALMIEVMKVTPAWAEGLPLAASGGIGQTYAEV